MAPAKSKKTRRKSHRIRILSEVPFDDDPGQREFVFGVAGVPMTVIARTEIEARKVARRYFDRIGL